VSRRGYIIRALIVWVILIAIEFVHGMLRAVFLVPVAGDLRSRQIGAFTGSLLVLAVALVFIRWIDAPHRRSLLVIGLVWLVLTLSFELAFGRLSGLSWDRLLSDYDVRRGGFLLFGMAVLLVSPLIAARLRSE
jgi:hypothetical protein